MGASISLDEYMKATANTKRINEQEEKVLNLCREWYRTAKNSVKQTLWYEIGVMLENDTTPNKACSRRVPRRGAKVVKSKSKVSVSRTRR